MLGILYDIHGNLPALERVLEEASGLEMDRWLLGGDYGTPSPWPDETLAQLRELPNATWIRGNGERWLREPPVDRPEVMETYELFRGSYDEELVDWLYSLPPQAELDGVLYVHGSPLSDVESFHEEPREDDEKLLNGVRDRTVVFGHSHLQFRRPGPNDTELINPGSVGMPLDGDVRAAWATWDGDFEFRRTEYDVAKAAAGYRSLGGDFGEFAANADREGLGLDRVASTEISTFPFSACETGQFSAAPSAASRNSTPSIPSTSPSMASFIVVSRKPASVLSKVAVAFVSSRAGA